MVETISFHRRIFGRYLRRGVFYESHRKRIEFYLKKKAKQNKKIKEQQENNKKGACTCKTLRGARMEMTYPFKIRFVILKYRNNQVNDCFLELCCKLCSVFLFALQHVHHEKQGREKKNSPNPLSATSFCFGFAQTIHISGTGID